MPVTKEHIKKIIADQGMPGLEALFKSDPTAYNVYRRSTYATARPLEQGPETPPPALFGPAEASAYALGGVTGAEPAAELAEKFTTLWQRYPSLYERYRQELRRSSQNQALTKRGAGLAPECVLADAANLLLKSAHAVGRTLPRAKAIAQALEESPGLLLRVKEAQTRA